MLRDASAADLAASRSPFDPPDDTERREVPLVMKPGERPRLDSYNELTRPWQDGVNLEVTNPSAGRAGLGTTPMPEVHPVVQGEIHPDLSEVLDSFEVTNLARRQDVIASGPPALPRANVPVPRDTEPSGPLFPPIPSPAVSPGRTPAPASGRGRTPSPSASPPRSPTPPAIPGRTPSPAPSNGRTPPLPRAASPARPAPRPMQVTPTVVAQIPPDPRAEPRVDPRLEPRAEQRSVSGPRQGGHPAMIGPYKVLGRLAKGGMAIVYEAEHATLERPVAIKVLREELSSNREAVGRFRNEALAISRISHPGIVTVFDHGYDEDGAAYLVMERLRGEGLSDRLSRERPLPVAKAIVIATQVAQAVAAAHEIGIVHRDLKPENVFLLEAVAGSAQVKVLDFGVAKIRDAFALDNTQKGVVLGTPHYMSPEQLESAGEVGPASDIYSLGVILFEMVIGTVPFPAGVLESIPAQRMRPPAPRTYDPTLPVELDALILEMLSPLPSHRPQTMMEVAARLGAVDIRQGLAMVPRREPGSEAAHTTAPVPRPKDPSRPTSRRGVRLAILVCVLAACAGAVAALYAGQFSLPF